MLLETLVDSCSDDYVRSYSNGVQRSTANSDYQLQNAIAASLRSDLEELDASNILKPSHGIPHIGVPVDPPTGATMVPIPGDQTLASSNVYSIDKAEQLRLDEETARMLQMQEEVRQV